MGICTGKAAQICTITQTTTGQEKTHAGVLVTLSSLGYCWYRSAS
jgi:hypothetical protein